MARESNSRNVHSCRCPDCRKHPFGGVAKEHRAINRLLSISNERLRRLLAGFLADQLGRGGISRLARITGLDRATVARGRCELHEIEESGTHQPNLRIRRPGGGRKRAEVWHPGH
jgi:hypothetical protein